MVNVFEIAKWWNNFHLLLENIQLISFFIFFKSTFLEFFDTCQKNIAGDILFVILKRWFVLKTWFAFDLFFWDTLICETPILLLFITGTKYTIRSHRLFSSRQYSFRKSTLKGGQTCRLSNSPICEEGKNQISRV